MNLDFEKAAILRDRIKSLNIIQSSQKELMKQI